MQLANGALEAPSERRAAHSRVGELFEQCILLRGRRQDVVELLEGGAERRERGLAAAALVE